MRYLTSSSVGPGHSLSLHIHHKQLQVLQSRFSRPSPWLMEEAKGDGVGTPLLARHCYWELIGSLPYITNTTRLDIAHAVGILYRYRMAPITVSATRPYVCLNTWANTYGIALVLGKAVQETAFSCANPKHPETSFHSPYRRCQVNKSNRRFRVYLCGCKQWK